MKIGTLFCRPGVCDLRTKVTDMNYEWENKRVNSSFLERTKS